MLHPLVAAMLPSGPAISWKELVVYPHLEEGCDKAFCLSISTPVGAVCQCLYIAWPLHTCAGFNLASRGQLNTARMLLTGIWVNCGTS